jgi:hypothetical protein
MVPATATTTANPKILFTGQGTNSGIPKRYPSSTLRTRQPRNAAATGTDRNETAGKLQ